jgi:hypothetical protein
MRQGGDPRLPLELALVKVTRPGSDLSRESTAYRLEQLEQRGHAPVAVETKQPSVASAPVAEVTAPSPAPPSLDLQSLQEAWQRTILPAVEERSIPTASVLREARLAGLADDRLTLEFPSSADFHRKLAEDPKNATLLVDALYEVTGRKLAVAFQLGEHAEEVAEEQLGEDEILELVKETFDARELKEGETD